MRRYVVPLFAANSVALVTVGISYYLYSRLLSVEEFGLYSIALAVGSLLTVVLDTGFRASLIKHTAALAPAQETAMLGTLYGFSGLLLLLTGAVSAALLILYPEYTTQTFFIAGFATVYLLTSPWIAVVTARLERDLRYKRLAYLESVSLIVERCLPVLLLYAGATVSHAFIWALLLARACRVAALSVTHRIAVFPIKRLEILALFPVLREGLWYQAAAVASSVRDNIHIFLIGPLFGVVWVGYYSWGMQLCMLISQVFVQISARISLPLVARQEDFEQRWRVVIVQVGVLAAITGPILTAALFALPGIDRVLFDGKWHGAIVLLPWLFVRMLPGAATAPMGSLLLVEQGAAKYSRAVWLWTALEVVGALLSTALLGEIGLGVSYSVMVWFGLYMLVAALNSGQRRLFVEVLSTIMNRASFVLSFVVAVLVLFLWDQDVFFHQSLTLTILIACSFVLIAYVLDGRLRQVLRRG